jgi:outer membrane protein
MTMWWSRRTWCALAAFMVLLTAIAGSAQAQAGGDPGKPLGVEECVAIARAQSDLIGQAEGRLQSAEGARLRSYSAVLPSVSASVRWNRSTEYFGTASADVYSGGFGISGQQTIFSLPSIFAIKAQGQGVTAASENLDEALAQVDLAARQQFYACVASLKLADIEDEAVSVASEQLRRSETLFRLGSVARSDVLQAQVNLTTSELQAMQRRNGVGAEHARLAVFLGLDPRTALVVDTTLAVPMTDPGSELGAWIEHALTRRSDLAAARAALTAAELSEKAARWQRLPYIGASANWGRSARGIDALLDPKETYYSNSWGVSVGLNLDLFTGLSTEGDIESAKGALRTQRETLERLEKEATLEVRNAWNAILEERENLRVARTSVSLAEENLRLQQALYESGAGTLLEWDNARLSLRRARVSMLQVEITLILAHAGFWKSVGGA